jgi:hypothetical protein
MDSNLVIGTSTVSLAGLECVGHSLEVLNVTNCSLTAIEACFVRLIQLRHLNLAENKIARIENLQK